VTRLIKTLTDFDLALTTASSKLPTGKQSKFTNFRILNDLQAQNGSTLGDLQSELTESPDLLIILGQLGNLLNKEFARSKSAGRT
jgi:hypothetical protein